MEVKSELREFTKFFSSFLYSPMILTDFIEKNKAIVISP